jgi:hypothetical protein
MSVLTLFCKQTHGGPPAGCCWLCSGGTPSGWTIHPPPARDDIMPLPNPGSGNYFHHQRTHASSSTNGAPSDSPVNWLGISANVKNERPAVGDAWGQRRPKWYHQRGFTSGQVWSQPARGPPIPRERVPVKLPRQAFLWRNALHAALAAMTRPPQQPQPPQPPQPSLTPSPPPPPPPSPTSASSSSLTRRSALAYADYSSRRII